MEPNVDTAAMRTRKNAARAFIHPIGAFKFKCLAPTGADFLRAQDRGRTVGEQNYLMVLSHVTGWEGVRLADLEAPGPGETGDAPAPFSREALELFLEDHLAELGELVIALDRKATERALALEAAPKKLKAWLAVRAAEARMVAEGTLKPGTPMLARLAEPLSAENRFALLMWNRFDGCADGATLALMCELYDVDDLDALLMRFEILRIAAK